MLGSWKKRLSERILLSNFDKELKTKRFNFLASASQSQIEQSERMPKKMGHVLYFHQG